jgi:hypothetical protein
MTCVASRVPTPAEQFLTAPAVCQKSLPVREPRYCFPWRLT